jgi:hypothetical protein
MHELNSIYGVNTLMKFHPDVNWEFSFLIADLFQTQKNPVLNELDCSCFEPEPRNLPRSPNLGPR